MRISGTKEELSALKEALSCPGHDDCPRIKEYRCIKCSIAHNDERDESVALTYDEIEVVEDRPQTPGQLYGGIAR